VRKGGFDSCPALCVRHGDEHFMTNLKNKRGFTMILRNLESIKGLENNLNAISIEIEDFSDEKLIEREADMTRVLVFELLTELTLTDDEYERINISNQLEDYERQLEVGEFDISHYESDRQDLREEFEEAITQLLDYARGYIADHNLNHLDVEFFLASYEEQLRTMYEEQKYHMGSMNHNTSFEHVLSRFTYMDGTI